MTIFKLHFTRTSHSSGPHPITTSSVLSPTSSSMIMWLALPTSGFSTTCTAWDVGSEVPSSKTDTVEAGHLNKKEMI